VAQCYSSSRSQKKAQRVILITIDPYLSLLTCCRVMERIINNEIWNYNLLKYTLISHHQHGFIKRRSTCTNLLECLSDWSLNMQSKLFTDVLYFDFKKAFDSVSHDKLLVKVATYGISGDLYQWILTFLHDRTTDSASR